MNCDTQNTMRNERRTIRDERGRESSRELERMEGGRGLTHYRVSTTEREQSRAEQSGAVSE
jgi:hypothetical protein